MDKLRSIDIFVKVAEKKSIVATARALDVSASGVSRVIAALECSLGFSLFHRSTRRIGLTVDGALYLEHCRRILQEFDEAESEVRHHGRTPSGMIKVAMHAAFRNPFCLGIGDFLNKHPNIRLETKFVNQPSILFDEGFDILVRIGELADSNLVARHVGWVELITAASRRISHNSANPRHRTILRITAGYCQAGLTTLAPIALIWNSHAKASDTRLPSRPTSRRWTATEFRKASSVVGASHAWLASP